MSRKFPVLHKETPLLNPRKVTSTSLAQESSQVISGTYDLADFPVALLLVAQKVLFLPSKVSAKSVPPVAKLKGVEPMPFTAMPPVEKVAVSKSSQPAAAPSPAETKTETPSNAACCHRLLMNALPLGP